MLQPEKLIDMYEKMLTIRSFEEKAVFLFRSGVIGGAVHPSIGQEAVAVGTCENLSREDFVTSTHRGHGHCIAKGAIGILGSNGIVGAGIPIAVGAAFRNIYKKESNRVVVCFFGDGGANQGSFHESLNMAAIWRLPVVFLCENNVWAISTRSDYASSGKSIGERACAYGIPGAVIDGNDVLAVYDAVNEAVGRCRSGEGPTLLECKTYRIEGHFVGDPRVYCKKEEVEDWKKRCPILAFEDYLFKNKMLTEEDSKSIRERVREKIEDAVQFAQNSPFPSIDTLERDVYGFKADNS